MIKIADKWKDYEVIACANGQKFERWGDIFLLRPDPQVIWGGEIEKLTEYKDLNALYKRSSSGGGNWHVVKPHKPEWTVGYNGLKFLVKPMGFKHTGLFPEQAVNWDMMSKLIVEAKKLGKNVNVLNLFGYSGAASVICAHAGASVCHVDASKAMVDRCKQNASLNKVDAIRYIVDDCFKFVKREINRGNFYDIIIMDPPSFGRGPNGEAWKIEENLFDFVKETAKIFDKNGICFLINSYTTGLQPSVIKNILTLALPGRKGVFDSYEIGLPVRSQDIVLPCGCSGVFVGGNFGR